jgi:hypothetical protein
MNNFYCIKKVAEKIGLLMYFCNDRTGENLPNLVALVFIRHALKIRNSTHITNACPLATLSWI